MHAAGPPLDPVHKLTLRALHPEAKSSEVLLRSPVKGNDLLGRVLDQAKLKPDQFDGTKEVIIFLLVLFEECVVKPKCSSSLSPRKQAEESLTQLMGRVENSIKFGRSAVFHSGDGAYIPYEDRLIACC